MNDMRDDCRRRLDKALADIHDGHEPLLAIARKQCRVTSHTSSPGVRTTAPLPLNLGAWQLARDIDELVLSIARALRLPTRHRDTTALTWTIRQPCNLDRLLIRDDVAAIARLTELAAKRLAAYLEPDCERVMVGGCTSCGADLWVDGEDIAAGWAACAACGGTCRIRDVAETRMLRLAACGVTGTAASLSGLLRRCGVPVRMKTISEWHRRGVIRPAGTEDGRPVFLLWDVWIAATRHDR